MHRLIQALEDLKNLCTVDTLHHSAMAGVAPKTRPKINSHIHLPPNFSAYDTVAQVAEACEKESIGVVGVTNYYDFHAYGAFAELARSHNIFPLYGVELIALIKDMALEKRRINDPVNPGKIYLCGKGSVRLPKLSARAALLLQLIRDKDSSRINRMTNHLSMIFASQNLNIILYDEDIKMQFARRHMCNPDHVFLQERHICRAFQELLFERVPPENRPLVLRKMLGVFPTRPDDPVAIQNDIRNNLLKDGKPAYIVENFLSFDQSYELVLELGAIPCYPVLADGAYPVCEFEDTPENLIQRIKSMGIYMTEFIPNRNSVEMLCDYVLALRAAGIPCLAGTEHNTLDQIPLDPCCRKYATIPDDIQDIFYEGACVVAAHQFLVLNDQCGYVDSSGKLNPAYKNNDERIASFRSLGAALIELYFTSNTSKTSS